MDFFGWGKKEAPKPTPPRGVGSVSANSFQSQGSFGSSSASHPVAHQTNPENNRFNGPSFKPTTAERPGLSSGGSFNKSDPPHSAPSIQDTPVVSGFSFVAPDSSPAPGLSSNVIAPVPVSSGFSFVSSSEPPQDTAVTAPAVSGFSFMPAPVAEANVPSSIVPPVSSWNPKSTPSVAPASENVPFAPSGVVKKKVTKFRPGSERHAMGSEGVVVEPNVPAHMEEPESAPVLSTFAGLNVIPTSAPVSSLSFMNQGASEIPTVTEPPVVSSFAFMNSVTPDTAVTSVEEPAITDSILMEVIPSLHNRSREASISEALQKTMDIPVEENVPVKPVVSKSSNDADVAHDSATIQLGNAIQLLSQFSEKCRRELSALSVKLKSAESELASRRAKEEEKRIIVQELELRLNKCVENENFEEADHVSELLSAAQAVLEVAQASFIQQQSVQRELELEVSRLFESAVPCANSAFLSVTAYETDRQERTERTVARARTHLEAARESVAAEEEQLRLKAEHVARESQLVAGEEAQVNSLIRTQSADLTASAERHRAEFEALRAEADALEQRLRELREREAAALQAAEESERRIEAVRAKFEKQERRLRERRAAVAAERAECASEAAQLSRTRLRIAQEQRQQRLQELKLRLQGHYAHGDREALQALRSALAAAGSWRERSQQGLTASRSSAASLAAERAASASVLSRAAAKRAQLEAQAQGLQGRLGALDTRLPELKAAKQGAVEAKKFKEAARLNDELKSLTEERDGVSAELTAVVVQQEATDAEVQEAQAAVAAVERQALELEKEAAVHRIQELEEGLKILARGIKEVLTPLRPFVDVPTIPAVHPTFLHDVSSAGSGSDSVSSTPATNLRKIRNVLSSLGLYVDEDSVVRDVKSGGAFDVSVPWSPPEAEDAATFNDNNENNDEEGSVSSRFIVVHDVDLTSPNLLRLRLGPRLPSLSAPTNNLAQLLEARVNQLRTAAGNSTRFTLTKSSDEPPAGAYSVGLGNVEMVGECQLDSYDLCVDGVPLLRLELDLALRDDSELLRLSRILSSKSSSDANAMDLLKPSHCQRIAAELLRIEMDFAAAEAADLSQKFALPLPVVEPAGWSLQEALQLFGISDSEALPNSTSLAAQAELGNAGVDSLEFDIGKTGEVSTNSTEIDEDVSISNSNSVSNLNEANEVEGGLSAALGELLETAAAEEFHEREEESQEEEVAALRDIILAFHAAQGAKDEKSALLDAALEAEDYDLAASLQDDIDSILDHISLLKGRGQQYYNVDIENYESVMDSELGFGLPPSPTHKNIGSPVAAPALTSSNHSSPTQSDVDLVVDSTVESTEVAAETAFTEGDLPVGLTSFAALLNNTSTSGEDQAPVVRFSIESDSTVDGANSIEPVTASGFNFM